MAAYPVEALLRPRVEGASVLTAWLTATFVALFPSSLMMTPGLAYAAALVLYGYGFWRLAQYRRLTRYQRGLIRLPRYVMPARKIPVSRKRMFIGKGFQWGQRHTQRLRETLKPDAKPWLTPSRAFQWARTLELTCENIPGLRWLSTLLGTDAWWNPVAPLPPVGGNPALHGVGLYEGEKPIFLDVGERVGHTLVLGTTRVGKTRLAELLIQQDIARGDTVIVFDPKGDPGLLRAMVACASRHGRLDDFYTFHLAHPEHSARYNPVGNFQRITEVANRVANQLSGEGNSAAFKEFGWRFINIIARALVALGERPDYTALRRYVNDIEPLAARYFQHWLEQQGPAGWRNAVNQEREKILKQKMPPINERGKNPDVLALSKYLTQYMTENSIYDPVVDGLQSAFKYDKTYFDKIVASLGPLLEKLTTGKVAELIAPDYSDLNDHRPIFNWEQVIRANGIVYVGLAALTDATVASAVGNSMFADLCAVAGSIYDHGIAAGLPDIGQSVDHKPISLHADEFNELIGPEFIPLLNKAGGAKFQTTVYTQTWDDVEARLGNRAQAGQVAGNLNTMIMLRVKDQNTARMLTDLTPKVQVQALMRVSGASDSSDPSSSVEFSSNTQERVGATEVPAIEPGDVLQLPKGQAFAVVEGGKLLKVRLPLPAADDDAEIPDDIAGLVNLMEQEYTSGAGQWAYDTWYENTYNADRAPGASHGGSRQDRNTRQPDWQGFQTGAPDADQIHDDLDFMVDEH